MTEINIRSYELEHETSPRIRRGPVDFILDTLARSDVVDHVVMRALNRRDARHFAREAQIGEKATLLFHLAREYTPTPSNTGAPVSVNPYNYDGKEGYVVHFSYVRAQAAKHAADAAELSERLTAQTADISASIFYGEAPNFYQDGQPVSFRHQGMLRTMTHMNDALSQQVMPHTAGK